VRLSTQRSGWNLIPLNLARIADMQNHYDRAADYYVQSIKLGNRNPVVLRRAMQLMLSSGRFTEFNVLIQQLQDDAPSLLTRDVRQAAAQVLLQRFDPDRAVAMAREAVATERP